MTGESNVCVLVGGCACCVFQHERHLWYLWIEAEVIGDWRQVIYLKILDFVFLP